MISDVKCVMFNIIMFSCFTLKNMDFDKKCSKRENKAKRQNSWFQWIQWIRDFRLILVMGYEG